MPGELRSIVICSGCGDMYSTEKKLSDKQRKHYARDVQATILYRHREEVMS